MAPTLRWVTLPSLGILAWLALSPLSPVVTGAVGLVAWAAVGTHWLWRVDKSTGVR